MLSCSLCSLPTHWQYTHCHLLKSSWLCKISHFRCCSRSGVFFVFCFLWWHSCRATYFQSKVLWSKELYEAQILHCVSPPVTSVQQVGHYLCVTFVLCLLSTTGGWQLWKMCSAFGRQLRGYWLAPELREPQESKEVVAMLQNPILNHC